MLSIDSDFISFWSMKFCCAAAAAISCAWADLLSGLSGSMRALRAAAVAADCEPAEDMRPGGRSELAPGPKGCWLRLVATAVLGEGEGDEEVAAAAAAASGFR